MASEQDELSEGQTDETTNIGESVEKVENPGWGPETIYLLEQTHNDVREFILEIQLKHDRIRNEYDNRKRILHQSIVEVGLEYMDEVAERTAEIHERLIEDHGSSSDAPWEPKSFYMAEDAQDAFEKFLLEIKLEHGEFRNKDEYLKRELKHAVVLVGMEHAAEVAERADHVYAKYGNG